MSEITHQTPPPPHEDAPPGAKTAPTHAEPSAEPIKCRLCGKETNAPCGPLRGPVCTSCWLATGCDDFLCEYAPDLKTALEMADSGVDGWEPTMQEIFETTKGLEGL
jgi:hypothetical protein